MQMYIHSILPITHEEVEGYLQQKLDKIVGHRKPERSSVKLNSNVGRRKKTDHDRVRCQLSMSFGKLTYISTCEGDDPWSAIDGAVHKIEAQLEKSLRPRRNRHQKARGKQHSLTEAA